MTVPIVDDATCVDVYRDFSPHFVVPGSDICAGYEGHDACYGDSGGPLYATDSEGRLVEIGLTSRGAGCATKLFPGVFTDVRRMHGWIHRWTTRPCPTRFEFPSTPTSPSTSRPARSSSAEPMMSSSARTATGPMTSSGSCAHCRSGSAWKSPSSGYIRDANVLPNVVARVGDEVVGVCLIRRHNPVAAEIELMAVPPDRHRQGIGRRLIERAAADLASDGVALLQVKTFGPSGESEEYERTRAFYAALGFLPLEERTDIWGPEDPCLISVRPLGS